jgi:SAM-dependent methyltransferase
VEALPFSNGVFDVVTALGVFEYVEPLDVAFAECHRVLRAGGTFIVSLLNRSSPYRAIQRVRQRITPTDTIPAVHFTRSRALHLVKGAGFRVERFIPFDMGLLPPGLAEEHPRIWKSVQKLFEPLSRTPLGRFSSAMLIQAKRT